MKTRKKGLLILLSIICLTIGFAKQLLAFTISVSNPRVEYELQPGETISNSLTISNPSDKEVKVKVYLEDFNYIAPFDGTKEFLPAGTTEYSSSTWFTFSPQEFTLAPFSRQVLKYTLRVPDNVKPGEYYAVMFFETALGSIQEQPGHNVLVMGRVGSLFFIKIAGYEKKAQLTNWQISKDKLEVDFANIGNTFIRLTPTYFIMDKEGLVIDRGKINDLFTMPSNKVKVEIPLPIDKLSPAQFYTVFCNFDLADGDVLVREINIQKGPANQIQIIDIKE